MARNCSGCGFAGVFAEREIFVPLRAYFNKRGIIKVMVGVVGGLLALLGIRWMFAPLSIAAEQGLELTNAVALNTARGDLGGFFIAGALLCGIGLRTGDGRWLQAVAVVVGCVALGRVVGMLADGFVASSLIAFCVEGVMVAVLLTAARPARAGA